MRSTDFLLFASAALAAPQLLPSTPCFITGTHRLPTTISSNAKLLSRKASCSTSRKSHQGVPDVTINDITFSSISFAESDQTPLAFSMGQFATREPLASNALSSFQDQLDVYLATEAGLASLGKEMESDVPILFLHFQMARIRRAQRGKEVSGGMSVDQTLSAIVAHAVGEDQELIDELRDLAIPAWQSELKVRS